MTTIATTILDQLGGRQFCMMTGSKNFMGSAHELQFKVGRNAKGVTHVRVTLRGDDTYDVTYMKVRKFKVTELAKSEGIYCDMLRADFERETGLYTRLV